MTNILIDELKKHPQVIEAMIETLKSLIEKDEAKKIKDYFKIGEFYYFWDDIEDGYIYGELHELDHDAAIMPFSVVLPGGSLKFWFENASKELPKN